MANVSRANSSSRRYPGSINAGIVIRSVGYLQGGYYTGAAGTTGGTNPVAFPNTSGHSESSWSQVQLFNTNTQVGQIVYDTTFYRRYVAGITGNHAGYFSVSTSAPIQHYKFSYVSVSQSVSFQLSEWVGISVFDLGGYTKAWAACLASSIAAGAADQYYSIALSTDTPTNQGTLSSSVTCYTRQGLSSQYAGFFANESGGLFVLDYTAGTVSAAGATSSLIGGQLQYPSGMSVTNSYGYFCGYSTPNNIKITYITTTVTGYSQSTNYTYLFGESHSLTSDIYGFMMAGYYDTSGRYSGVQHGLCQRITLTTEAITTLNDLVLPQSSGQMMTGF
jgi:hypothetical protein